jgi:hypothetical protein
MKSPFDLSSRVAVVTGGNEGIGLGMARGLAAAGARIALAARNRTKTEEEAAVLTSEGSEVLAVEADVTREDDCQRLALDHPPRKAHDDCLQELRWLYDRRSIEEVRQDLAAWIAKWTARYPKLVGWVEETIEETLTFYRLPRQHHKHLKSTNMLERLNEEIKRRTHVVRIFPNADACLRLVRALAVETHENWLEAHRYLNVNMNDLREHKKIHLRSQPMTAYC